MNHRLVSGLLVASLLAGVHAAGAQAPAPTDSAKVAAGRKLFESKGLCFTCHGKAGEGLLAPTTRLAGRAFTHTKGSVDEIAALIRRGVAAEQSASGHVMPPKGGSRLTDSEIELVAGYVKWLNDGEKRKK